MSHLRAKSVAEYASKKAEHLRREAEHRKKYPVHGKLREVVDKSQALHDFIEFLQEKGIGLYKPVETPDGEHHMFISSPERDRLMYEFFDIDPVALENEKRAMVDELRKEHEEKTS